MAEVITNKMDDLIITKAASRLSSNDFYSALIPKDMRELYRHDNSMGDGNRGVLKRETQGTFLYI